MEQHTEDTILIGLSLIIMLMFIVGASTIYQYSTEKPIEKNIVYQSDQVVANESATAYYTLTITDNRQKSYEQKDVIQDVQTCIKQSGIGNIEQSMNECTDQYQSINATLIRVDYN